MSVMACAGDVPTLETLAAVDLLRQHFPDIKIRVINVVDLMTLQSPSEHPHGLSDREFDSMFSTNTPVIFAYHGYPWLDSSADLSAYWAMIIFTFTATMRRARPQRLST